MSTNVKATIEDLYRVPGKAEPAISDWSMAVDDLFA
jgi:hypothetical protein